MKVYPNQPAKPQSQAAFQHTTTRSSAIPNTIDEELIHLDVEVALIEATLSRD